MLNLIKTYIDYIQYEIGAKMLDYSLFTYEALYGSLENRDEDDEYDDDYEGDEDWFDEDNK